MEKEKEKEDNPKQEILCLQKLIGLERKIKKNKKIHVNIANTKYEVIHKLI
jgi:hypothetical protein